MRVMLCSSEQTLTENKRFLSDLNATGGSSAHPVLYFFLIISSWYHSPVPSPTLTGLAVIGTQGGRQRFIAKFTQTPNVQISLPQGIIGIIK